MLAGTGDGSGELAKHLPCQPSSLSFRPRTHREKAGVLGVACNLSAEEGDPCD